AGAKHVLCVLQETGQVQLEARCAGVQKGLGSEGTMTKLYVNGRDNAAVLSGITAKLTQDKTIDAVLTLGAPYALIAIQGGRSQLRAAPQKERFSWLRLPKPPSPRHRHATSGSGGNPPWAGCSPGQRPAR